MHPAHFIGIHRPRDYAPVVSHQKEHTTEVSNIVSIFNEVLLVHNIISFRFWAVCQW